MEVNYINICLSNNIIPECLDYSIKPKEVIDYNKLNYLKWLPIKLKI